MAALSQVPEMRDFFAELRRKQLRIEQPSPHVPAEDPAGFNPPINRPRRQSIKGEPSNSLGKGAPARKQLLFYPPASFKRRQKTQSNLTKGD